MSEFGKKARAVRKHKLMEIKDVAEKAGISLRYLTSIETDSYDCPPLGTCLRIADALECSIEDLDPIVRVPLSWLSSEGKESLWKLTKR